MLSPDSQAVVVNIECCQNCAIHSWFTHHSEGKYEYYFNEIKQFIEKEIQNVTVEKNALPSYLVQLEPKFQYQEEQSQFLDLILNKTVQYPRIGSFEISIFNVTIFSKITTSVWPNFQSILNTLKCIIFDKSQNKIVQNYSVIKDNDQSNQQKQREFNLQNNQSCFPIVQSGAGISRKSGSTSPRPHNGVRVPPLSNQSARSNSPKQRNVIKLNESLKQSDDIQSNSQVMPIQAVYREKTVHSQQKMLPPLIDRHNNQSETPKNQGQITKTNFYTLQGQDDVISKSSSPNSNQMKNRENSPQSRFYNEKRPINQYPQNMRIQTNRIRTNEGEEQAKISSPLILDQQRKEGNIQKPINISTAKVKFDQSEKNPNNLQQNAAKNIDTKSVPLNKRLENKNDLNSSGGACDMKIKTVKIPNRNIYSNIKKNQTDNMNGQDMNDSIDKNKNPSSPSHKNNPILNHLNNKNNGKQIILQSITDKSTEQGNQDEANKQSQIKQSNGNSQKISPRPQAIKYKKIEIQADKNNSQINNNSYKKTIQPLKKLDGVKASQFGKDKDQTKKEDNSNNSNIEQNNTIDQKSQQENESQELTENQIENNTKTSSEEQEEFNNLKQTLTNISRIENQKSEASSSNSLFSPNEKLEKQLKNSEDYIENQDENGDIKINEDQEQIDNEQNNELETNNKKDEDSTEIKQQNNIIKQNSSFSDDENNEDDVGDDQQQDDIDDHPDNELIKDVINSYLNDLENDIITQLNIKQHPISYDKTLNTEQKLLIKQNTAKLSENHKQLTHAFSIKNKEYIPSNNFGFKFNSNKKQFQQESQDEEEE